MKQYDLLNQLKSIYYNYNLQYIYSHYIYIIRYN